MNSKSTPVLIVLLVVASFLIGKFYTENQYLKGGTAPTTAGTQATPAAAAAQYKPLTLDLVKTNFNKALVKFGKTDSKLVLVEVSDPSCPYCQVAAGQNGELNKQFGSQFTLVSDGGTYVAPVPEIKKLVDAGKASLAYLYYPGHGAGEMGTKALYCAFNEGKFWEAEKLLMSSNGYNLLNNTVKNDKTKSGDLADFLKNAVDPVKMKTCLDSGKYDAQLTVDTNSGKEIMESGAQSPKIGTPGFFVNATYFNGAYSYKDMETVVNSALQ